MPYAIRKQEIASVCYAGMVHPSAWSHIQGLETQIQNCIWKPGPEQLIEELGNLADDMGSTCTKETRYTKTLGLFWYTKMLLCQALTDCTEGRFLDNSQGMSLEVRMDCMEGRLRRLTQAHMDSDARLNVNINALACELTGKTFSQALQNNTASQLIFHHQLHLHQPGEL